MKNSRSPWLQKNVLSGGGLLIAFVVALLVAFTVQKGVPFKHYSYVNVEFADAGSLRVGDDVRVHSVREGQVNKITVGDSRAVVRLQLPGDAKVYQDATATIRARSALGQAYVDLQPGSPDAGDIGTETLALSRTRSQEQLDTLLDVFDKQTRARASQAARSAGVGASGHGDDLSQFLANAPDTLTDLGRVSETLASDQTDLPATLDAAATLSRHISSSSDELARLVTSSGEVLGSLAVDKGVPLRNVLLRAPGTLADARSALAELQEPIGATTDAVRVLRPGIKDLARQTPDLRRTLNSGTKTLRQVPSVARLAEPAVSSLADTASDLRPLAPQFSTAVVRAQQPLQAISSYGNNAGLFFDWFADALSQKLPNGNHYLRLDLVTGLTAVSGTLPIRAPLTTRNPYPSPYEAYHEGGN
ncbi:hypothetical protein GCM10022215_15020 [Nocardioides fonticola]|uniref:Mce/MlaD domain-containing protein n=1 Tax=Nocardioides fonticola TaxID=450363 RepID=A0ABP7XHP4_9ACTN